MSISRLFAQGVQAAAAGGLALLLLTACKPAANPGGPAKPPAPKASATATNIVVTNQYVSEFQDLLPPRGIDPFYPDSHRRDPAAPAVANAEKPPPAANILLKGVVGAAAHRLAVIGGGFNNSILEAGESGSVRVANGQVRFKCIEVGENYALVQIEAESQPRKLELKKGF